MKDICLKRLRKRRRNKDKIKLSLQRIKDNQNKSSNEDTWSNASQIKSNFHYVPISPIIFVFPVKEISINKVHLLKTTLMSVDLNR